MIFLVADRVGEYAERGTTPKLNLSTYLKLGVSLKIAAESIGATTAIQACACYRLAR